MDSHHEMVMKARQEADSDARVLYFAYSTILDKGAFSEWQQQHGYTFFTLPEGRLAQAVDVKLVFDFPSRFWGGRVAGLEDAPGHSVYGKLFEISAKDWPVIQHKEGAITGMSVERPVHVVVGDETLPATAFATSPDRKSSVGPVSATFLQALLRGAKSAGLPEAYVKQIKAD
jgi:hypothetical protein